MTSHMKCVCSKKATTPGWPFSQCSPKKEWMLDPDACPVEVPGWIHATLEFCTQYFPSSGSSTLATEHLCRGLTKVSEEIASTRIRLINQCHRHLELPVSKLVLWKHTSRHQSWGHLAATNCDIRKKDAGGKCTANLARCMEDWEDWKHCWRACPRAT